MSRDRSTHQFLSIGLVACSMIVHEILLTRICALRLYFHFAFLVISNCLLGLGASGTLITLYQHRWRERPRHYLTLACLGYAVSLVATYIALLEFPLPDPLDLARASHLAALSIFSLLGALPFVFGGVVIGMLLTFNPARANRLYGVDLIGAGLACFLCPALLPLVGAGGVFIVTVMLAIAAVGIAGWPQRRPWMVAAAAVAMLLGAALLPSLDAVYPVPTKGFVDYVKALNQNDPEAEPYSVWTANSRIDMFKPPQGGDAGIFGRGSNRQGLPADPSSRGIAQDATAGTVLLNFSEQPETLPILARTTYAAAAHLKSKPKVFVIGLGGGNDVWANYLLGARHIKAIELNWPIVDLHRRVLRSFSRTLTEAPNIELVVGEGRSALMRETELYDIVQMSGVDTWTALASGAYVLAENYLYTSEAIELMYSRLAQDGILQITRFAQTMEALRLLSNVNAAFESLGVENIDRSVMAVSAPDQVMAVLVKKGVFTSQEQDAFLAYAERAGLQPAYVPKTSASGPLHDFLTSPDKVALIRDFPRDITPTTDDRPYFFNFTKWSNPLAAAAHADEIPSVSQGNPLMILSQLALSIVLSALLIVWPVARQRSIHRQGTGPALIYFSGLGLGFILIEVALMQKLTLFLGQPVYSLSVTLFALLVFTGLGSLTLAGRLSLRSRAVWLVPASICLLLVGFVTVSPPLLQACMGWPLPGRVAITVVLLAPIGLLLGIPFAFGLRVLDAHNPRLAPWAWAVNGCASVIGSILTVVISMNAGFNAVLLAAAVVYLVAFAALRHQLTVTASRPPGEPEAGSGQGRVSSPPEPQGIVQGA